MCEYQLVNHNNIIFKHFLRLCRKILYVLNYIQTLSMQSKLSERQKKFLIYSFHKNSITGFGKRPDTTKSAYNSNRRSIHLLIKRGLVEQCNEGKYLKKSKLTEKGYVVAEKLLLGDNAGFTIKGEHLKDTIRLITKRNYLVYLHIIINHNKVRMEVLDEKRGNRLKIKVVNAIGIQGYDCIVVKIQHLREDLKKYLRKSPEHRLYVISIKTQDSLIWLNIKTLDKSWDFYGVHPVVFGAPFQVGGLKAIGDVWPIEPDKTTI